ncbi:HPP family protein [Streptomyces sp. NRRL F-2664]|uniref:HPP family protein n=1 Tax=Streptomyces sp. NRRL F-2664 TaxID=1463842 RepID=UPI001F1F41CB|nr:HPP family protein [Streptomyces sp. NRRL F-2664]
MEVDSVLPRRALPGAEAARDAVPLPRGPGRLHRARAAAVAVLHGSGAVVAALLALAALGVMVGEPVLIPSMAASAAVLHHTPGLPTAQPRTVVVAHLLGAAAGYTVLTTAPGSPWSAAVAAGLTFAATSLARTPHSPACATAVVVVLQTPAPARFVPLLFAATVVLVLGAVAASRTRRAAARYPVRWW